MMSENERKQELSFIKKTLELTNSELSLISEKYSDDYSLFRLYSSIGLIDYCDLHLVSDHKSIAAVLYLAALESIVGKKNREQLIAKNIIETSSREELNKFIISFAFTEPFLFETESGPVSHVVAQDGMRKGIEIDSSSCGALDGYCGCMSYLKNIFNKKELMPYIKKIIENFYYMRNSLLHDGYHVWFFSEENMLQADAFSTIKERTFIRYSTDFDSSKMFAIFKKSVKNYLIT